MSAPPASVIVRAKDEETTIDRTLASLERQTVRPEILVLDSGSTDRTREIATGRCDRLIDIPGQEFTYGRGLNIGARAASAPIHFSLSAHCFPEADWIERSLEHYERPDVAGTGGQLYFPDGSLLRGPFLQDGAHARSDPWWGFSNHASSWRGSVQERFPFDELMDIAEDREWSWRVLDAGFVIAFDPALWVNPWHRHGRGVVNLYARIKRESRAIASFSPNPPYTVRDCVRKWWRGGPRDRSAAYRRLNYFRWVELAGKRAGQRQERRLGAARVPQASRTGESGASSSA